MKPRAKTLGQTCQAHIVSLPIINWMNLEQSFVAPFVKMRKRVCLIKLL